MAEKRRGLGRGLGALIPSGPVEEVPHESEPERVPEKQVGRESPSAATSRKQGGRPVDLFFERVTEDDVAEQPRSYSSALRSGINKNVLDAQTKRVAKGVSKKTSGGSEPRSATRSSSKGASAAAGSVDDAALAVEKPSTEVAADEKDSFVEPALSGETETESSGSGQADGRVDVQAGPSGIKGQEQGTTTETPGAAVAEGNGGTAPDQSVNTATSEVSRETVAPAVQPLQAAEGAEGGLVEVPGATFADLTLDSIHPNRKQPRVEFNEDELAELVHSIREIGVLQPVVVRPSKEAGDAPYELVMGERRLRASREAGMETIPAIIRSTLDDDLLRDALLENLHRSALNPLEEAAAYQQLLDDFGCSHDELAGRLGRSRPQISNTLRLMKLPPLVQRRVAAGILSAGHARALLGLADPAEMEKLAQKIVAEGLSVRSTEEIVALSGGLRRASKPATPKDGARHERLDYLATSLSDRLDTSVKITLGAKKGRVSIEFASVDDLNRIIGVLSPAKD